MTKEDIIKEDLHYSKPLTSGPRNKANTAEGLASKKPGDSGKHWHRQSEQPEDRVFSDKDAVNNTTI